MNKNKIQEIINNGTIKEKINLYMEDIAMRNVAYDFDNPFLTDKQKTTLSESITTPKDVKYYNQLAHYSRAYLMYKPYLSLYKVSVISISKDIERLLCEIELNQDFNHSLNEIINLVYDATTNKKVQYEIRKSNKKRLHLDNNLEKINLEIQKINTTSKIINQFYAEINTFLKKHLPLKPYIDFTKNEENTIKETLKKVYKKTNQLPITQIIPYDSILSKVSAEAINTIITASK